MSAFLALDRRRHPVTEGRTFAGLDLATPKVMGIVNVTPDSFSDGGEAYAPAAAIARGRAMAADGAPIVDVGGESTRPGAAPVPEEEEMARVLPVITALAGDGLLVSVDTRRAPVMAAAIDAGARIVNDVSALTCDPAALGTVAGGSAAVILMHMRGDPRTMQQDPRYDDVRLDVRAWLQERVAICRRAGLAPDRIAVDPGIGFGKTVEHNLDLLAGLEDFADLGCAVVVGVSRKSFIARLSRGEEPKNRLAGSLAAGLWALAHGAHILRVHDVAATCQALAVWQGLHSRP